MRLHFQEKPWDLYVAVGYTVVMAAVLLALSVGNLLAILLVLFVPGYVLVAALFPGSPVPQEPEIDWIERIALSFGLSIAVVPLLGLLLNFTPWGISFVPIVATITIFTVGVTYAAYWRRMRLPTERRLSLTMNLSLPDWKQFGALDKSLTIALSASIAVAGGTLVYVILTPQPGERFTEFYILNANGTVDPDGYPRNLSVSQPGTVIIGVVNHEFTRVTYTVRVDLIPIVFNSTSGVNETDETNRTTIRWLNQTLDNQGNWRQPFTFSINSVGRWGVEFLLYRDDDFSSAYQELHLAVRVS